jgi:hypothetical protein
MLQVANLHFHTFDFSFQFAAQGKAANLFWFLLKHAGKHISNGVRSQASGQEPTNVLDRLDSLDCVFPITVVEPEGVQQSPLFIVPQGTSAGIRASRQFADLHVSRMLDIDASVKV